MRIGVDVRPLHIATSRTRGIGIYVANLVQELKKYQAYEIVPYAQSNAVVDFLRRETSFRSRRRTLYRMERAEWLIRSLFIKHKAKKDHISIFHSTDPLSVLPPSRFYRAVATVYDIIPLLFEEDFKHKNFYGRYLYKRALQQLKKMDKIITLSYTSREDIHHVLRIPREKIVPIYLGVAPYFKPTNDHNQVLRVKEKYGVKGKYILNVGGVDHRKNIIRLLEAYSLLSKKGYKEKVYLVQVGGDIELNLHQRSKIFNKMQELKLDKSVIFCGAVDTADLVVLYNGAELLSFPSLYEGFGLPLIEAMACGTPVVTSNVPSLKEISGDAAVFVNPMNTEDISIGILKLLSDNDLRKSLKEKGLKRAANFTWEKTAQETAKVYEEILTT
ncbi:MAG: hypothetical protein A3C80_00165 [Candidatus Ryanbacteria bacterium RIFCSPHIGHO2_02_FULL_45_43]|uniref:Glycosyl transferase family 1 domain-containing protein n=1 Tax=Candidatus Ryanbacteria bacterium RIFCSPHIGHO2_01_45_13 TaxID=1802112 RepID=A0A1G2G090_9BACT|nr:MAG: hypothetical protein A2718_01550 [Candidatus Ryanbacteria bacterium RIFCSPHIGHO2_01_FULL_44_130]OGZ43755.1 MAG: hypothetical protein A2W41_04670 [Candidatus Ryanbacteria bacterium RIFCSPHIGHO2_01_45_13]OGZ47697.1 MAG: hypothetical protein A3C80_00165 [Candidatus Ryanbacteria bacterium RIFCSPHIGHO2_02_FULL_45_43]OGZ49593.1 MAG: hypothetical protein A3E55_04165 [Candidatus Ryanbacteria bacterium RIFCSPHIGHO2_12_FULL_44_20]OGZ51275.1 MAG: hypothetical protein A3A17_04490 [Candidatus Ryanba